MYIFNHNCSTYVGTAGKTDLYKDHQRHILLFCDGYDIKIKLIYCHVY
jgi:hypothetical protein